MYVGVWDNWGIGISWEVSILQRFYLIILWFFNKVWQCDSDMFSMLVHNCFVDDGAGKDRKPLIDEHGKLKNIILIFYLGCTNDPIIVSDLTYNSQANLAFTEVNVFKVN